MPTLKPALLAAAKLGVAGAVILAIAWIAGVVQLDGQVRESQADILDFNPIKLSKSARFAGGLENLGHDEPQSFSINGNVVHFSVNHQKKRPEQLMKEYQEEFVRQGLNSKVWDDSNARGHTDEMFLDAITGAVVPIEVNDEYAAMGGVITGKEVDDEEALEEMANEPTPPNELFKGHQYVEMFWDRHRRKSTVTASWSDENFDYAKMVGGMGDSSKDLDVDPIVPACPGCERLSRVRDLDPRRSYSSNSYGSPHARGDTLEFYRGAMQKRGWEETDSSIVLSSVRPYVSFEGDEAHLLQFSKGARFLTIMGFPDETGQTTVHTVMSE